MGQVHADGVHPAARVDDERPVDPVTSQQPASSSAGAAATSAEARTRPSEASEAMRPKLVGCPPCSTDSDLPLTADVTVLRGRGRRAVPGRQLGGGRGADGVSDSTCRSPCTGAPARRTRSTPCADLSHAHEDHIAGLSTVDATHVGVHEADLLGVCLLDGIMEVYGLHTDAATAGEWRNTLVQQFHLTA